MPYLRASLALSLTLALTATVSPAGAGDTAASLEQAERHLADGEFDAARAAYRQAAEADPGNAAAWFGLGRALRGAGENPGAVDALRRAIELEHPAAEPLFLIAGALAAEGDADGAIASLRRLAETGSTAQLRVRNAPEFQSLADVAAFEAVLHELRPCRSPEHRQFDFWLGDWDVTSQDKSGFRKAHNRISSVQGGCALLEEYDTPGGYRGTSLNFYDATRGAWHQTWIDNQGGTLHLEGGLGQGGMVLESAAAEGRPLQRITWEKNLNRSVRQHWQSSTDGGENWTTVFDGIYTQRK